MLPEIHFAKEISMNSQDSSLPEPTDDSASDISEEEDVFDDEDDSPACPICKCLVSEDTCEHVISTIGADQINLQVCQLDHETSLRQVVGAFTESFAKAFTADQLQMIVNLLELPGPILGLAKEGLECADLYEGIEYYFQDFVTRAPGYAGSENCFGDGGGTSSDWCTAWAKDAKKAGRWLDREIPREIKDIERTFRGILKAGKQRKRKRE